jgi:riboflavin transporter FmnP
MLVMSTTTVSRTNQVSTKQIAIIGICAAISFVLMFVKFPISYLGFLELEVSDVPAAIVAIIYGPVSGVLVELIKNVLHLTATSTGMSGELSNFMVSLGFVIPLGLIAKKHKCNKGLILGFIAGTIGLMFMGIVTNYFVTVPLYLSLFGEEAVMGMVQATIPSIDNIMKLVMIGITPFNMVKGIIISVVSFLLYKSLKDRV